MVTHESFVCYFGALFLRYTKYNMLASEKKNLATRSFFSLVKVANPSPTSECVDNCRRLMEEWE